MIATIAERFFPEIAAIVAIIWKPALNVNTVLCMYKILNWIQI